MDKNKRPWRAGTLDGEYEPNWANAHVKNRVEKVLDWASEFLIGKYGTSIPLQLPATKLNDVFGPKGHDLGDYLRKTILIPVSRSYRPGEHAMSYRLAQEGFEALQARTAYGDTKAPAAMPLDRLVKRYAEQLHTLTFEYRDSSNRLWHGLQNLPKQRSERYQGPTKAEFWQRFGLPLNYDIAACAPTILFQLAKRHGLPAVLLETLQAYLDDRHGFREHVASLAGLNTQNAKQLINSLFNGARLGANTRFSSFEMLGFDDQAMARLIADPKVARLRTEISRVWKRIESQRKLSSVSNSMERLEIGQTWKLKSSRSKWGVYFEHERQIMDAIQTFLAEHGIRNFAEHDGFRTEVRVPVSDLQNFIEEKTGFQMKIEED